MSSIAPGSGLRQRLAGFLGGIRSNPTIAAIATEGFLTRLGFGMVGFALPLFALHLGMSLAEVGGLYALHGATVLAIKPLMGWAADRFGRKRTLVFAVAMRCVVGVSFIFAFLPWHLFAIRILQGVMTAARDPSASALIAVHGKKKSMASAFAWYYTARDVGHSLGAAAAGLLIAATGEYRLVFAAAFVTSCVALVSVVRYVRETPAKAGADEEAAAADETLTVRSFRETYAPLLPYFGFGLLVSVTAEMMRGIFPIVAVHYGHLTVAEAGIAASASSIAILAAGPAFAWLSDNVHRGVGLTARSIANGASSLIYIFWPGFAGFTTGRVLDDAGKAAFRPSWGATLAEVANADPARRARIMAFLDLSWNMGEILGPLAAGVLMSGFGVPLMLGVRAALSLATEGYALVLFRGKERG
ncbi:MAG TPA: MFS transporter [Usitatibacter sp.]|nr:MFS transporter [Usitatibacter sp.]